MSINISVNPYGHEQIAALGRFLMDYAEATKVFENRMPKDVYLGSTTHFDAPPPVGANLSEEAKAKIDAAFADRPSDLSADTKPAEPEAEKPKPRGRPKKDTPPAAPTPTEPEVKAQDEADEAAESAGEPAEVPADDPAPVEVLPDQLREALRGELGAYGKTYGMEHALSDMPEIIGAVNVSSVPVEKLQAALDSAKSAIANNPYKRALAA